MAVFSVKSERALATCDMRLQEVLKAAIKRLDFSVVCGYRSPVEQFELFKQGRDNNNPSGKWRVSDRAKIVTYCDGKLKKSKHNLRPSQAVDIVPCGRSGKPVWSDEEGFERLATVVLDEARRLGVRLQWGGLWKMKDYPHFELV